MVLDQVIEEAIEMQERKRLEDIIKELPEDLRKELEDFADKFTSKEGERWKFLLRRKNFMNLLKRQ